MADRLRTKVGAVELKNPFGINGAQSGLDIARMMLAGASAVAVASPVMLRGYGVLSDALAQLDGFLERKGVTAVDLIGRAADRRKSFADMPVRPDNWRNYVPAGDVPGP